MRAGGPKHDPTPLGDRLRAMAIPYAGTGNAERGQGLVQAADLVDEEAHLLSGRAFVDALDRMIEHRLESFAEAFVADVVAALRDGAAALPAGEGRAPRKPRAARPPPAQRAAPVLVPPPIVRPAAPRRLEGLGSGERKVLTAIAQHAPEGVTFAQLQVLTGFKARTRQTYVARLMPLGLVARGGRGLVATDRGLAALGPSFAPLPTGKALLDHWLATLGEGERTVLQLVARYYPHPASVQRIEEQTGYAPRTRQTYIARLKSRHLVTTTGSGVQACDHLFDPKPQAAGAR